MDVKYSAVLTGASFMLFEFRQLVPLKDEGMSDKELKRKVLQENMFQYARTSSLKRGFPSVLRRVNVLDGVLRSMVMEGPLEFSKVINLYAIMKTDRLFFEFMDEVIREKLEMNDHYLEKKDLNYFFQVKAEQNSDIANWTETTVQKLKQIFRKILLETGMLEPDKSDELNRLIVDEQIKSHLQRIGDDSYVRAMGE